MWKVYWQTHRYNNNKIKGLVAYRIVGRRTFSREIGKRGETRWRTITKVIIEQKLLLSCLE